MIVQCINNIGNSPPLVLPKRLAYDIGNENFVSSSEWFTINAELSGYCITKGNGYKVYGVLKYIDQIRFLIIDNERIPGFFPHSLFKITDYDEDADWESFEYKVGNDLLFFTSYPSLAQSYNDVVELIDCTNDAMCNFWDCVLNVETSPGFEF